MTTYNDITLNRGATINKNGEAIYYKTGYQVSMHDLLTIDLNKFTQADVEAVVEAVRKQYKGCQAGFWVDDGKVYCDISKRVATKKLALQLGKQLNQISVWDWKNQRAIYC